MIKGYLSINLLIVLALQTPLLLMLHQLFECWLARTHHFGQMVAMQIPESTHIISASWHEE